MNLPRRNAFDWLRREERHGARVRGQTSGGGRGQLAARVRRQRAGGHVEEARDAAVMKVGWWATKARGVRKKRQVSISTITSQAGAFFAFATSLKALNGECFLGPSATGDHTAPAFRLMRLVPR